MKIRISLRKDVFINFIAIDTILSYNITLFTKLTLFIINLIYKIESIRKNVSLSGQFIITKVCDNSYRVNVYKLEYELQH